AALREEIQGVRQKLRDEIHSVQQTLRDEIQSVRIEIRDQHTALLRWLIPLMIGQVAAIAALVKLF
ncbi:MAG: hypothetical protein ACREVR_14395, partial [Burkholderiales bacterium]